MDEEIDYEEVEEDEKKKKRRIFFIWFLIFAIVAIAIVIIILLTTCRKQTSNIDIVYEDKGVDAIVIAYSLNGDTMEQVGEELAFDKDKNDPIKTISMPAANLNKENDYTIFVYYFENASDTERMSVTINTDDMNIDNMDVTYYVQYGEQIDVSNNGHSIINSTSLDLDLINPAGATTGSSAYVYIKVKIHDPGKNGEYSGELHWILEPVTNE